VVLTQEATYDNRKGCWLHILGSVLDEGDDKFEGGKVLTIVLPKFRSSGMTAVQRHTH
jgi:hypothetical protein